MRAGSMSVRVPKHKEKIKAPLPWCFLVILQVHTAAAVYCLLGDIRKDFVRHTNQMKVTTRAANSYGNRLACDSFAATVPF